MSTSTAPSLVNLCADSLMLEILRGEDEELVRAVYDLPTELFDCLLNRLPALALQTLHLQIPHVKTDDEKFIVERFVEGRKRVRLQKFNLAWMQLFKSRWPEIFIGLKEKYLSEKDDILNLDSIIDWQQKYWETHLQCCLDAAAEMAMLPSFSNCLAEIRIPDKLLKPIGYEEHMNGSSRDYLHLLGHCQQFARYIRFLRLQNVHCTAETIHLLRASNLEGLAVRKINTQVQRDLKVRLLVDVPEPEVLLILSCLHGAALINRRQKVDGLCNIVSQNIKTLKSLDFIHCKLSSVFMDAIHDALNPKSAYISGLEEFFIRSSKLNEMDSASLPIKLLSFVLSGRSLAKLHICDNHIQHKVTSLIMKTIVDASCGLHCAQNSISGCLCYKLPSLLDAGNSLQSLRELVLRGNGFTKNEIRDLKSALTHMPMLETLDLGDNHFGNDIVRCLIPKFTKASSSTPLTNLYLNNCKLSLDGATELLELLSKYPHPLQELSLADNDLGSNIAAPLSKFLETSICTIDIQDIGLGLEGFLELEKRTEEAVNLVSITMSGNRGGIGAAKFVAKVLRCAPKLVSIEAGYNIMPVEALPIIYSALKDAKGNLRNLNLTGNIKLGVSSSIASELRKLEYNGKPIVTVPSVGVIEVPYDDDP